MSKSQGGELSLELQTLSSSLSDVRDGVLERENEYPRVRAVATSWRVRDV